MATHMEEAAEERCSRELREVRRWSSSALCAWLVGAALKTGCCFGTTLSALRLSERRGKVTSVSTASDFPILGTRRIAAHNAKPSTHAASECETSTPAFTCCVVQLQPKIIDESYFAETQ
jgi:hypothetical protein